MLSLFVVPLGVSSVGQIVAAFKGIIAFTCWCSHGTEVILNNLTLISRRKVLSLLAFPWDLAHLEAFGGVILKKLDEGAENRRVGHTS